MGQYFKPINLDRKEWLRAHDYRNGLKLLEHSYLGNNFMETVEQLLIRPGSWYKNRIVWAGDYAEYEDDREVNLYEIHGENNLIKVPQCWDATVLPDLIINHTLKEYISKKDVPYGEHNMRVHPLSIMTIEGANSSYLPITDYDIVGRWARHIISIEDTVPDDNYVKIEFNYKIGQSEKDKYPTLKSSYFKEAV